MKAGKFKKTLSLMLACALAMSLSAAPAFAAKGDGGSREDTSDSTDTDTSASGLSVTIPEGLTDGTYTGDATVEPDESEQFNFYNISVAVSVADGAITGLEVSGASSSDTQYSERAESGILEQLNGKTAGTYDVDVVTTATCSSNAIVTAVNAALQSTASDTSLSLGDSWYDPNGTTTTLTITNHEEGVDYSDISIAYAVGKFSSDLTADTDYTVTLVSSSDDAIVYEITILSGTGSDIADDDLTHSVTYNSLGMNLDVTVAGSSAGRITITSSAAVTLENNTLSLTGGNGETLSDYINEISDVTISYVNADGETVSDTQALVWQHDVEPTYTASDIFNEDGSINFGCAIFANGADGDYTIEITASGFDTLTAAIGASCVKQETPGSSKAAQKITVKKASLKKTIKAKKLAKKKVTFKIKASTSGDGKITYKKLSGNKKITVSKNGKITVKKGLKKKTYKVKVKIKAAATDSYKAKSVTKTLKIKVK